MLRAALFVVGGALLAGAAVSALSGCSVGTVLRLTVPGAVLLFGLLVEHWRYKPLSTRSPGPDWVPTKERFVGSRSFINPQPVSVVTSPGERGTLADRSAIQSLSIRPLIAAGHPTASTSEGTSEITAAPAPMTARSPIWTRGMMLVPVPMNASARHVTLPAR